MKLLDLINGANSYCGVSGKGKTVFISLAVKGTHVLHLMIAMILLLLKIEVKTDLLKIDITEDQLLVAAVDDSWPVTAGKHVADRPSPELPEYCGLGA